MKSELAQKGIKFDEENLNTRAKTRKTLADIERNQNARMLNAGDGSEDSEIDENPNEELKKKDQEQRGRNKKRRRNDSIEDVDMEGDTVKKTKSAGSVKMRAQSKIRSMSAGRREGSVPQRKYVEPEHLTRLAKKINKRFKHSININEADRSISVKKPKHLFAGKTGRGEKDRR